MTLRALLVDDPAFHKGSPNSRSGFCEATPSLKSLIEGTPDPDQI